MVELVHSSATGTIFKRDGPDFELEGWTCNVGVTNSFPFCLVDGYPHFLRACVSLLLLILIV